jgi:hypothetical protein
VTGGGGIYTYPGGAGGRGGQGGRGGAGGGGAGGPSAGAYRSGPGSAYVSRSTTESGGAAGAGGLAGDGAARGENGASAGVVTAPGSGTSAGDFDGDGIGDGVDECPALAGPLGCPSRAPRLVDSDSDGIPDADDACPATAAGPRDENGDGCPDPTPTPTPTPEPTPTPTPTPEPTPTPTPRIVQSAEPPAPPSISEAAPAVASSAGSVSVQLPSGEIVPLAGLQSIPIGSVVDARKGQISLRSRRASVRVRAGIFKVRRERQLALVTPKGAAAACKRRGPAKGAIRSLSVVVKGQISVVAGAAVLTPAKNASWTTSDRCEGTLVEVAAGTVRATTTKGHKRTLTVKSGHSYLVRARLFAARS